MTLGTLTLLSFLLGLRAIMLIGSVGAMVGALLMFLQGGFYLHEACGRSLPDWMKIEGVSQLKGILSEVVVVVLIVIFARVVVEANGKFEWVPISILLIALGLRMIELAGGKAGSNAESGGGH
jgi:uncharacterized membrane protein YqhA